MSKFKFIFSYGKYELSAYSDEGSGATFAFPEKTEGAISVGGHSYPLAFGRVRLDMNGFADGGYTPLLVLGEESFPLPEIKKNGNKITFSGYNDSEICKKFDEIRALRRSVRELKEKQRALEEYVFGKGLF